MKKILLIGLMGLLGFVGSVWAQDNVFLVDINEGWRSKSIENVQNGSIGVLLEAFHRTWPTYVTRDVCGVMEEGLSHKMLDPETEYTVTIDAANGYAEVSDAGTDGLYMQACVWNRTNGHKLFAVMIGKPTDPELEVVCFYDYDAKAKRLTPEPKILNDFHRKSESSQIAHDLPRKGKELIITEYDLPMIYTHRFRWNGMQPVFDKVELDKERMKEFESLEDDSYTVFFKGKNPNISDFVNYLLSQEYLGEALGGMAESWKMHQKGQALQKGRTITVDSKNGYVRYGVTLEDGNKQYIEFCYWNCADGKHKLVAESIALFVNGQPTDTELTGLTFYMYDANTRKLTYKYGFELGVEVNPPDGSTGCYVSLPRVGKTIEYVYQTAKGKVTQKQTWNGSKFVK